MFTLRVPHGTAGEAFAAVGRSTPPVTVTALSIAGVGLQDWVYILTALWLIAQISFLVWKWVAQIRGAKPSVPDA